MSDKQGAPSWRVLLIEDSRDDAELAEIALREGGLRVECRRAWSAGTVREALDAFAPQLVLSDLNLPGFSGMEALALVRAHDADLPFVFLTGATPDTRLVTGAVQGLLSKNDLTPLAPLVRRLLPAG